MNIVLHSVHSAHSAHRAHSVHSAHSALTLSCVLTVSLALTFSLALTLSLSLARGGSRHRGFFHGQSPHGRSLMGDSSLGIPPWGITPGEIPHGGNHPYRILPVGNPHERFSMGPVGPPKCFSEHRQKCSTHTCLQSHLGRSTHFHSYTHVHT